MGSHAVSRVAGTLLALSLNLSCDLAYGGIEWDSAVWDEAKWDQVLPSYSVSVSSSAGGTIDIANSISVTEGETFSFTATPNSGFELLSIDSSCGGALADGVYTSGPITAVCSVTVTFDPIPTVFYTLSVSGSPVGGTVTPAVTEVGANRVQSVSI